jgi:signal transduction histidine kinase
MENQEQVVLPGDFEKRILAIVGHDIRGPLGTIQFAARRLHDIPDPTGATSKHATMIGRGAERIQRLVEDLLDLARERGRAGFPIHIKVTSLLTVCQGILDQLETTAHERPIAFECETDGQGIWDEQRVLQAISNLVSNAVRHGSPGSSVSVRITGDSEQVTVDVRNYGSIATEMLPHIFEPFCSGHSRAGRGEGLGLGLYIARSIARAHNGSLEVQSSDDATTFRLVLPRQPSKVVPPAAATVWV